MAGLEQVRAETIERQAKRVSRKLTRDALDEMRTISSAGSECGRRDAWAGVTVASSRRGPSCR